MHQITPLHSDIIVGHPRYTYNCFFMHRIWLLVFFFLVFKQAGVDKQLAITIFEPRNWVLIII